MLACKKIPLCSGKSATRLVHIYQGLWLRFKVSQDFRIRLETGAPSPYDPLLLQVANRLRTEKLNPKC